MPSSSSFSLPCESAPQTVSSVVNNPGNQFGIIKRGFKTEITLSFPREICRRKNKNKGPVFQPRQLK